MHIGYHASHEQAPPSHWLRYAQRAAQSGFDSFMCSDHFHPWSAQQGHSGFAWSWLGAALATTPLQAGIVNAPGYRYHPAIIAQAAATLCEMFPGRFWMAVGSGELLNENIVGGAWPPKAERNARLLECVQVMRALWAGDEVTHRGHILVQQAKLYTRPEKPPLVVIAALSPETARWAGSWADGMVTISAAADDLRRIVGAFREGGGEGKPIFLQVKLSYDASDELALQGAHEQWRTNIFSSSLGSDLATPAHYEAMSSFVRAEDMHEYVHVSSDIARHVAWLQRYAEFGFERLMLHNVNRNQTRFIDDFAANVLPQLR